MLSATYRGNIYWHRLVLWPSKTRPGVSGLVPRLDLGPVIGDRVAAGHVRGVGVAGGPVMRVGVALIEAQ